MRRLVALAALCFLLPLSAPAQSGAQAPAPESPAPAPAPSEKKSDGKTGRKKKPAPAPPAGAAPAASPAAEAPAAPQAPGAGATAPTAPANPALAQPAPAADREEFRRQVMEEVRRELQKAKDEVKQETAWVAQDSQARVQDSEAVDQLRQRVNLFQPHGYLRLRPEFFYNMDLGRGVDPTGHTLFPVPFIGASGTNHSMSMANMRFRFEPTLEVSEDLGIYAQIDALDNVLLGSSPLLEPYLDPFTPLSALVSGRAGSPVIVKRLWGRVNTQLGEFVFGRMGYHWGLGILHNDGNCLDCDFGDTYDRVAFSPRDFKGHKVTAMFDVLAKGQGTTGEFGELGRVVDLDTLDDGYRIAVEVVKLDTLEEAKRKIDAGRWVVNYGLVVDYRTQSWDTITLSQTALTPTLGGFVGDRTAVVQRHAKIYQPDAFVSLRRGKFRLDAELAFNLGNVDSRAVNEVAQADPTGARSQPLTFFGAGFALQTDYAMLHADSLLFGLELGGASADRGIFGFGARPWRNGSGRAQDGSGSTNCATAFCATGPGDIDGSRFNFSDPANTHGHINSFRFNRAFTVDTILFRNIISQITSSWYLKPSVRYRPTGRKTGGGDDTGFEIFLSGMYASTWYAETAPGLAKPLGLEGDVGITYDTSDHFHIGLTYAVLLPFGGLKNPAHTTIVGGTPQLFPQLDPSVAHAIRAIFAIPF
jgi:uncharacterized protein (TIGR04551 family)